MLLISRPELGRESGWNADLGTDVDPHSRVAALRYHQLDTSLSDTSLCTLIEHRQRWGQQPWLAKGFSFLVFFILLLGSTNHVDNMVFPLYLDDGVAAWLLFGDDGPA